MLVLWWPETLQSDTESESVTCPHDREVLCGRRLRGRRLSPPMPRLLCSLPEFVVDLQGDMSASIPCVLWLCMQLWCSFVMLPYVYLTMTDAWFGGLGFAGRVERGLLCRVVVCKKIIAVLLCVRART